MLVYPLMMPSMLGRHQTHQRIGHWDKPAGPAISFQWLKLLIGFDVIYTAAGSSRWWISS